VKSPRAALALAAVALALAAGCSTQTGGLQAGAEPSEEPPAQATEFLVDPAACEGGRDSIQRSITDYAAAPKTPDDFKALGMTRPPRHYTEVDQINLHIKEHYEDRTTKKGKKLKDKAVKVKEKKKGQDGASFDTETFLLHDEDGRTISVLNMRYDEVFGWLTVESQECP